MAHLNAGPKRCHRARGGHLPAERRAACSATSLDGGPLMFAEFAADDSRLRFRGLNDVQGSAINPQRPLAEPADALNLIPLSEA